MALPRLEYDDVEAKAHYVEDVVKQIIKKDIRSRNKIRNIEILSASTMSSNNYGAPMLRPIWSTT